MNTNDNTTRINAQEDVIELGVASVETQGLVGTGEAIGNFPAAGISED
jgi:hypothetical protein